MRALLSMLTMLTRALDSRVAVHRNGTLVATRVGRISDHPEFSTIYLASIPFTNGDAWEAIR